MIRSLVEAAGLASYKIQTTLKGYLVEEKAQTAFSANRKAIFVDVDDAIRGIEAMMRDRRKKKLVIEKEWKDIRKWLIQYSTRGRQEEISEAPEDRDELLLQQQLV